MNAPSCCGPREANSCCAAEDSAGIESCCNPQESVNSESCCGPQAAGSGCSPINTVSQAVGYSVEELGSIPAGANMGLGCGNPTAHASLKEGEVVVDLGAGGGIDCFLAANAVGKNGSVIGVDMTPDMVSSARANALRGGYNNVDFRLGEIEHLPVADNSVDAIISNCVINLSPDKGQVFGEAYRVLKPGGRVMVSDIVINKELPESIKNSMEAYAACIAGASRKQDYLETITRAGFGDIEIVSESTINLGDLEGAVSSINVSAVKSC
ncbi:MAG TPA: arsenite methyltransferase [Dehalococcoidia bacterium]|nr:arsenite methyltransferase [Dehalococcoidia bacterium]